MRSNTVKSKAIDPVCRQEVDTDTRFRAEYLEQTYYFCSMKDKLEFLFSPGAFVEEDEEGRPVEKLSEE